MHVLFYIVFMEDNEYDLVEVKVLLINQLWEWTSGKWLWPFICLVRKPKIQTQ